MTDYTVDNNGFVTFANVPISRAGVLQYLGSQLMADLPDAIPDKIYNVYRPASALNNPETIGSFNQLPWFNKHKMVGDDFDSAESVGVQGTTGNDTYFNEGDNRLYTTLRLFGRGLKEAIKRGLNQLSCGMKCKYRWESGTSPDGQKYDVVQDSIYGNHLASVPVGRAGAEVAVAMDEFNIKLEGKNMADETSDGTDVDKWLADVEAAKPAMEALLKMQEKITTMISGLKGDSEEQSEPGTEQPEPPAAGEDEDGEDMPKKPEESAAMDEAAISAIVASAVTKAVKPLQVEIKTLKGQAMDEASVMAAFSERQDLINQVVPIVGQFDYSKMNRQKVAEYAVKKAGIACDSGEELAALKGFLAARKQPSYTVATPRPVASAQDAADGKNLLDEMGL